MEAFLFYKSNLERFFKPEGQSLIELLLVIGLAAIFLPAMAVGLFASRDGEAQQRQRLQAASILKEAEEAVRNVREQDWTTFAAIPHDTPYHPAISGSNWVLTVGSGTANGFTTEVETFEVRRDITTGAIVTDPDVPGATVDPSTKRIVITISWTQPYASSISSTSYLTRFLENAVHTETTQTDFNAGTASGVAIRATNPPGLADDGEISLGAGGHSDWCAPELTANTLDTPGQGFASFVTAIEGKAFIGTGQNSSGMAFMQLAINNAFPPSASLVDDLDDAKANAVFGEIDYAYITTDTTAEEVIIIDIRTTPFVKRGTFDSPGPTDGGEIYVVGSVGYMTAGSTLYTFNLDSKVGSRQQIGSFGLAGTATGLVVVGGRAFVSTNNSSKELQIINVSNPASMSEVGWANTPGSAGVDVYVDSTGNRAYLATALHASQPEFYIINTQPGSGGNRPILGSYSTINSMDPKAVTIVTGNKAILVGSGGYEYQVINISNESSPVSCGSEDVSFNIHDVASVLEEDGDAFSYIVTSDQNKEFQIMAGGPGGSYATSGTFESATFDPGYPTANNRFTATYVEPANTEIKFQVSMINKVGGICPTASTAYTYVGDDGTTSDYIDAASGVPVAFPLTGPGTYSNPGQCLRYKVYLSSTDGTSTPILQSVSINYSP